MRFELKEVTLLVMPARRHLTVFITIASASVSLSTVWAAGKTVAAGSNLPDVFERSSLYAELSLRDGWLAETFVEELRRTGAQKISAPIDAILQDARRRTSEDLAAGMMEREISCELADGRSVMVGVKAQSARADSFEVRVPGEGHEVELVCHFESVPERAGADVSHIFRYTAAELQTPEVSGRIDWALEDGVRGEKPQLRLRLWKRSRGDRGPEADSPIALEEHLSPFGIPWEPTHYRSKGAKRGDYQVERTGCEYAAWPVSSSGSPTGKKERSFRVSELTGPATRSVLDKMGIKKRSARLARWVWNRLPIK